MTPRAIAAAIGGGFIGALIWGAVAAITNYEIGLIAWAIGGLVGGAAVLAGGRGRPLAAVCAGIALVSIVGGKLAMSMFVLDGMAESEAEKILQKQFTLEMHAGTIADATEFARLTDAGQYTAFMVSHGYDGGDGVVSTQELEEFGQGWAPLLTKWSTRPLAYDEARTEYVAQWKPIVVKSMREEVTHGDVVASSIGFMDILFLGFGVFTAFGIVARRSDHEAAMVNTQAQIDTFARRPENQGSRQTGDAQALPQDAGPPGENVPRPQQPRPTTRRVVPGAPARPGIAPRPQPPEPGA